MRGYAAIGLWRPKNPANIGGVMRAAFIFGAAMVAVERERAHHREFTHPADTPQSWRHVPLLRPDSLLDALPFGCSPIAVEVVEGARPLPRYQHPQRAFYLFGPEDGSLPPEILERCEAVVSIPSRHCLNLAATVNVVLYDRAAKALVAEPRLPRASSGRAA